MRTLRADGYLRAQGCELVRFVRPSDRRKPLQRLEGRALRPGRTVALQLNPAQASRVTSIASKFVHCQGILSRGCRRAVLICRK